MPVVLVIVLILAAFAAVLCVRAANVKPRRAVVPDSSPAEVDGAGAADRLAQLVRIPTVSDYDESKVDDAQFDAFRDALRRLYPAVHEACAPCAAARPAFSTTGRARAPTRPRC